MKKILIADYEILRRKIEFDQPAELEVGDYVLVMDASHGWGSVERGQIGKVTDKYVNGGRDTYDIDFGEDSQQDWTGLRRCFYKVPVDNIADILEFQSKALDERVASVLADLENDPREKLSFELSFTFTNIEDRRRREFISVTIDVADILKATNHKEFQKIMVERAIEVITSEYCHMSKLKTVFQFSLMAISVDTMSAEEIGGFLCQTA